MTKPDNPTNWANSDSSLKQTVSASRQSQGWTTSIDSDLNLVGEKPPIKEWNGWMNIVGQWVDLIGDGLADVSGDVNTFIDFAKWEIGTVVSDGSSDYPYVADIQYSNSLDGLLFLSDVPSPVDTTDWDDYAQDTYSGARALELRDMLVSGLAIKIVDYSDVTWIIYADFLDSEDITMGGSTNVGSNPYVLLVDPISIGTPPAGFPGLRIIKIDDGVVTNPTSFSGFTPFGGIALDAGARFLEKNPNGVRIGMLGTAKPTQLAAQVSSVKTGFPMPVRRRWIRPLVVTKDVAVAAFAKFPMDFRVGGRYRWSLHLVVKSPSGAQIIGVYASRSTNVNKVGEFSTETATLGYPLSGEFQYLGTPEDAGISFAFNSAFFLGPDFNNATIDSLYQIISIVNNYITVEELY